MEQEVKQANQMPQEEEIDLVEVVRKLWKNRKLILKITVVFMVLGVLVALFSPKEYTAGCTMVPQSGDKKVGGNLSGLASMVGINLGGASGGEVLSPTIYPKIVASIPFKKDLMATPLKFEEYDQPITLLDYYTKDEYQKFSLGGSNCEIHDWFTGSDHKCNSGRRYNDDFCGAGKCDSVTFKG